MGLFGLFGKNRLDLSGIAGADGGMDPSGNLASTINQVRDPNHGYQQFQDMAAASTPGLDALIGMSRARGGGKFAGALGSQQLRGMAHDASGAATNQFGAYRLQAMNSMLPQLLGMEQQNTMFGKEMSALEKLEKYRGRENRRNNFMSGITGIAGSALGSLLGG